MKRKLLLALAMIFALALTLTACEHIHTFTDEWTYDEEYHWHKATCGDTDEVSCKDLHTMAAVPGDDKEECTVCRYSRKIKTEKPDPEPEEKHEHNYIDGICDGCGLWSSVTDVVIAQASKLNVWNYVASVENVVVTDSRLFNGTVTIDKAELKFGISANGTLNGCGHVEFTSSSVEGKTTLAVKDSVVYARGAEGEKIYYNRATVAELLEALDVEIDIEEVKQVIDNLNANTQQIQSYVEELAKAWDDLPKQEDGVKWIIDTFLKLNEGKSTADTTVYSLKYDALRAVNNTLKTTTVLQYFESAFGEGSFAKIPSTIEAMFDVKVGDILDGLEKQGYKLDDILTMLNSVIATYYPDEKINTVEQLLTAMGIDLGGVSAKEYILLAKPLTPRQMLKLAQAETPIEQQITVEQIIAQIDSVCNRIKNLTVYDLLAQTAAEEITGLQFSQVVEGVIDLFDEGLTVEFSFKNNVLQQVYINFDIDAQVKEDEADIVESTLWQIRQELVRFNVKNVCLTNGGDMQQDYSALIAEVNAAMNQNNKTDVVSAAA